MALTDINFQEGEKQDFLVELPSIVYSGSLLDIHTEPSSDRYLLTEIPSAAGNIFIMSE